MTKRLLQLSLKIKEIGQFFHSYGERDEELLCQSMENRLLGSNKDCTILYDALNHYCNFQIALFALCWVVHGMR